MPLVFGHDGGELHFHDRNRSGLTNYQDAWWNPAESGWGLFVVHQDNTLFSALTTYDFAATACGSSPPAVLQPDGSYLGDLFRTSGPPFNAQPFVPITGANIAKIGAMRFMFSDGMSGTLAYTVNGAPVSKSITPTVFSDRSRPARRRSAAADGDRRRGAVREQLWRLPPAARDLGQGRGDAPRTQSAIAGNVGGMGGLSSLSTTQLQAIVAALATVSPPPPPR